MPLRVSTAALIATGLAALPAPSAWAASPRQEMWHADAGIADGRIPVGHDHVVIPNVRALRALSAEPPPVQIYRTPQGEPLRVIVSPTFPDTPENRAATQSYVDFLGSRLHGSEITRLTSIIAAYREVQQICGVRALGCYDPRGQRFIVPGDGTPRGTFSKEAVATHEYGHHIARNRDNYPWSALDFGPKRWSRLHHICQRVASKKLWPGDQGKHYFSDPGEGWAHAYARYHYPRLFWQYNPIMRPIGATAGAVRADVLVPWSGPGTWVHRGTLRGGGSTTRTFRTPLDGRVVVSLTGTRSANLDLELVSGGRSMSQSRRAGSQEVLVANVCGTSRLIVRVRSSDGGGQYTLVARVP